MTSCFTARLRFWKPGAPHPLPLTALLRLAHRSVTIPGVHTPPPLPPLTALFRLDRYSVAILEAGHPPTLPPPLNSIILSCSPLGYDSGRPDAGVEDVLLRGDEIFLLDPLHLVEEILYRLHDLVLCSPLPDLD